MNLALALVVAAATGFISLSCEILWYRAYSFASEGSPAAFGMMLGFYLLGIAGGAAAARRFCAEGTTTGDDRHLRALGLFLLAANALAYLVVPGLARVITVAGWESSLPLVALSAGAMGAVFPLACHFGIAPDDRAGARLSYLYAANIAGSAAGSLLTGFVLMDLWPLRHVALFLALLGTAVASALLVRARARLGPHAAALACATLALALHGPLFDRLWERLMYRRAFGPESRFALVHENRNDVITVTADRLIYGGGAYDGAINTDLFHDQNLVYRAYALAAFHPAPRRVLVIGLSGGAWAHVIAHQPALEKLTVVEINPGYLDVIAKYPEVAGLLKHPKVEIHIDDGRRWLARQAEEKFDVIVQNTSQHWRAHMTHLLSREHMELVRSRLAEGGVFFFNTTDSPEVQATALAVFRNVTMMRNFALVSDAPIRTYPGKWREVLEGYEIDGRRVWDLSRAEHRARLEEVLEAGMRLEGRGPIERRAAGARVITDDNMASEWARLFTH